MYLTHGLKVGNVTLREKLVNFTNIKKLKFIRKFFGRCSTPLAGFHHPKIKRRLSVSA